MSTSDQSFTQQARHYIAILHKRRSLVISCLVVCMLVAVVHNYTARPLYQATTLLIIDPGRPNVLPIARETVTQGLGADYIQTQYQLLRGRTLAEKAVERLEFQKSAELQTGPLLSPWERIQRRFFDKGPAVSVDTDGVPLSPAVTAFRSRLVVEPMVGTYFVNLRFSAYDPQLAMQAANTLAQLYIDHTQQNRVSSLGEASGWLGERLREQQKKVEDAERALQAYREREGIVSLEERQGVVEQKLGTLNSALLSSRMARMSKETMLHQLRTLSPNQIEISPLVAGNASIQATRVQIEGLRRDEARMAESLGDKHPEMLRIRTQIKEAEDRLRRELSNTLRGLEAELVTAQQQESSILANMETVKRESFDINRKTVEYGVLQREVEINQELYKQLLGRSKEAGLETELKSSNVRVHEKAEMPRGPVSPNRMRNYRLALLLGLGLGIGLAVLLEHLDNTIKTPEDVKDQLNLPFLGVVPDVAARVPPVGTTSPSPLVARNPSPALAEAYRILRTNLVFSLAENTGQAIVITSASPSEGKTTTAINLAMSLAQASARVLLVEADLRRPGIHQHMGVAKAPGLTDLIVGKSEAAEAIQTTRLNGLMVIPCGHPTPNPAELLGSARMKDIVRALRSHYDWVLIDTPPILAMADTPVLCPIVDGVLLVVAAELSARPSVQRATDQIQSIGAKMLGVVLNKVDLERNSYYYGHYYGEYYRSYYGDAGKHESTRSPNIPTRPTGSGAGRAARRS